MNNILSILLALFGYSVFATGNVLQKKGISCLRWKGERDEKFKINLVIWSVGIFLTYIVSMIPTGIASKNLPPYIVSAISGWSISVVIILSYFILREKLYRSDLIFSAVIITCIFITGMAQEPSTFTGIDELALYLFVFVPFLLLIPAFSNIVGQKAKAVLFASFGGIGDGLAIVLINIGVKEFGTSVLGYLTSPILYIYVLVGITTAVSLQFAYKNGEMVLIAPLQTSLNIIYPIICSYFIFDTPMNSIQISAIIIIVFSCYSILKKH